MKNFNIRQLQGMAHSQLQNYIVPGLMSSLIGPAKDNQHGVVRLFQIDRDQDQAITPHSHRFDFQCLVLQGCVHNIIWKKVVNRRGIQADEFAATKIQYSGKPGEYIRGEVEIAHYVREKTTYKAGEWYGMRASDIHSIFFERGTQVLFFEGPELTSTTTILEPFVDGEHIRTFETKDWMFKVPPEKPTDQPGRWW